MMAHSTVLITSPWSRTTTRRDREDMADTPQASPSSPSMKLMALVMPAIHRTDSGMLMTPRDT